MGSKEGGGGKSHGLLIRENYVVAAAAADVAPGARLSSAEGAGTRISSARPLVTLTSDVTPMTTTAAARISTADAAVTASSTDSDPTPTTPDRHRRPSDRHRSPSFDAAAPPSPPMPTARPLFHQWRRLRRNQAQVNRCHSACLHVSSAQELGKIMHDKANMKVNVSISIQQYTCTLIALQPTASISVQLLNTCKLLLHVTGQHVKQPTPPNVSLSSRKVLIQSTR